MMSLSCRVVARSVLIACVVSWLATDCGAQVAKKKAGPAAKKAKVEIEEDVSEEEELELNQKPKTKKPATPKAKTPVPKPKTATPKPKPKPTPAKAKPKPAPVKPKSPTPKPTPKKPTPKPAKPTPKPAPPTPKPKAKAKPTPPKPAPTKPFPVPSKPKPKPKPTPTKSKPTPPQPTPAKTKEPAPTPKTLLPKPKLLNGDPAPAAKPQPPPTVPADATTILQLRRRIADLELQVDTLRNRPAVSSDAQQLNDLKRTQEDLNQRLNAVEKLLDQQRRRSDDGGQQARPYNSNARSDRRTDVDSRYVYVPRQSYYYRRSALPPMWPLSWLFSGGNRYRYYGRPVMIYVPRNVNGYQLRRLTPRPPAISSPPKSTPPKILRPAAAKPMARRPASQRAGNSSQAGLPAPVIRRTHAVSTTPSQPIDLTGRGPNDAARYYTRAYNLYWRGQYADALRFFEAAGTLRSGDARILYYQGLSHLAVGNRAAAEQLLVEAAKIENKDAGQSSGVDTALERLQGKLRLFVETYRSGARVRVASN